MCNRQKKPQKKPKAHQVQYHAGSPLERIHIDILGPLIETPRGNQYVLVVVDQFTKWVECYALANQTAERVARTLVSEFIGRLGCPLEEAVLSNDLRTWMIMGYKYISLNLN